MKIPFFRSAKSETGKSLIMTPRVTAAMGRPTPRIDAPLRTTPVEEKANADSTTNPVPRILSESSKTSLLISLSIKSIIPQLPRQIFTAAADGKLDGATIALPVDQVLPQLSSGKIEIPLTTILDLLPPDLVNQSARRLVPQQTVVLPLEEVVAAIPPEAFSVQHEGAIDIETPEFNELPKLFDEPVAVERPPVVETLEPEVSEEPVADVESEPVCQPQSSEPAVISSGAPMPQFIQVSMRSLVAAMPDRVFVRPRKDLHQIADMQKTVSFPLPLIMAQLRTARIALPLRVVIEAMPPALFIRPLPRINEDTVPLPLQEIVPQLPAQLFDHQPGDGQVDALSSDTADFADPFQEKAAKAETVSAEPEPAADAPVVQTTTFDDDSFSIFAEKSTTTEPAGEEPVAVEPEPVAETVTEPVAAVEPEPVVPVAEVPSEPVVEPVAETVAEVEEPVEVTAEVPAESVTEPKPAVEPVAETPEEPVVEPVAESVTEPEPEPTVEPVAEVPAEPVVESEPVVEPVVELPAELAVEAIEELVAMATEPEAEEPVEDFSTGEPVESPAEPAAVDSTPQPGFTLDGTRFLVDLNHCMIEDLMKIRGVGPAMANKIIDFRNAHGNFTSIQELRRIPGIGRKTFRALTGVEPRVLNRLLGVEHDQELSLQQIVELINALPGVLGCTLALDDGELLTGKLPEHLDQHAISVFAPQLFKKVGRYSRELRVGEIRRFTIFTDQQPLSIFHAGAMFLIVIHDPRRYSKALLRRCERISQEIARMCRQRAVV